MDFSNLMKLRIQDGDLSSVEQSEPTGLSHDGESNNDVTLGERVLNLEGAGVDDELLVNENNDSATDTTNSVDDDTVGMVDETEGAIDDNNPVDGDDVFEGFNIKLKPVKPLVEGEVKEGFARRGELKASGYKGGRVAEEGLIKKFSSKKLIDQSLEKPLPVVEKVEVFGGVEVKKTNGSLVADKRVRPGTLWRGGDMEKNNRFRYDRDDTKLSDAEKDFFLRSGVNYRKLVSGEDDLGYINPPMFYNETDAERQERIEKITAITRGDVIFKRGSGSRFGRKHREVIDFLANFRFAKPSHISYLFAENPDTSYRRLKDMKDMGLVIDMPVLGTESIWFLTKAGLILSGYDYKPVRNANINYAMLPHTFMVNYLAANIWGASLDVLDERDSFPAKNRVNGSGDKIYGDYVVSEFAIQSSFGRLRGNRPVSVYVSELRGMAERDYQRWVDNGMQGVSPERVFGNEFQWILFPAKVFGVNYHVPDLVVSRDRDSDGSPASIAVEFERGSKSVESYRRTIELYKYDDRLYGSHVWVVHSKGTANKLLRAAEGLDMIESGRMRIVPIITKNGVFREPQLWLL